MRAYDPHKAYVALIAKGFNEQQADAIIDIVTDATDQYVTKDYLDLTLDARLSKMKTELIGWMVGLMLGQIALLITLLKLVKGLA
jgi:hypothetical protein